MRKVYDGPLEELAELTGADYLSDLKTMNYEQIRRQMERIDPDRYTLSQWKDTADYLTGNDVDAETEEQIYEYLLSY